MIKPPWVWLNMTPVNRGAGTPLANSELAIPNSVTLLLRPGFECFRHLLQYGLDGAIINWKAKHLGRLLNAL